MCEREREKETILCNIIFLVDNTLNMLKMLEKIMESDGSTQNVGTQATYDFIFIVDRAPAIVFIVLLH